MQSPPGKVWRAADLVSLVGICQASSTAAVQVSNVVSRQCGLPGPFQSRQGDGGSCVRKRGPGEWQVVCEVVRKGSDKGLLVDNVEAG